VGGVSVVRSFVRWVCGVKLGVTIECVVGLPHNIITTTKRGRSSSQRSNIGNYRRKIHDETTCCRKKKKRMVE
jgi:hypothetical protein